MINAYCNWLKAKNGFIYEKYKLDDSKKRNSFCKDKDNIYLVLGLHYYNQEDLPLIKTKWGDFSRVDHTGRSNPFRFEINTDIDRGWTALSEKYSITGPNRSLSYTRDSIIEDFVVTSLFDLYQDGFILIDRDDLVNQTPRDIAVPSSLKFQKMTMMQELMFEALVHLGYSFGGEQQSFLEKLPSLHLEEDGAFSAERRISTGSSIGLKISLYLTLGLITVIAIGLATGFIQGVATKLGESNKVPDFLKPLLIKLQGIPSLVHQRSYMVWNDPIENKLISLDHMFTILQEFKANDTHLRQFVDGREFGRCTITDYDSYGALILKTSGYDSEIVITDYITVDGKLTFKGFALSDPSLQIELTVFEGIQIYA